MTRTTPPRPYDIAKLFPEIAEYARPAVRLHPRPGAPTAHQSSIGGPLLWPEDEPWPMCEVEHDYDERLDYLEYILALRRRYEDRERREREGQKIDREVELRYLSELREYHDDDRYDYDDSAPTPLLPVAQLYYWDVPGLPFAGRYDLLQILWCPHDHLDWDRVYPDTPALPRLFWRRTEDVRVVLQNPPRPVACVDDYVLNQCVIHPEVVPEYPLTTELPEHLGRLVRSWSDRTGEEITYNNEMAKAPGWKAMGHGGPGNLNGPYRVECDCGQQQLPLFTADSSEFDGGSGSWWPLEEADTVSSRPVGVTIGDGNELQIYYCPVSEHHTPQFVLQGEG